VAAKGVKGAAREDFSWILPQIRIPRPRTTHLARGPGSGSADCPDWGGVGEGQMVE